MNSIADILATKLYGRTSAEARSESECIRCRKFVNPFLLKPRDLSEYRITALCPACWNEIFENEEPIS